MRVAVIHIGQETNDFNPQPTSLDAFRQFGISEGGEILTRMAGRGQVGGMLDAVAESGMSVDWVPVISAWAMAGGRIDTESRLFFEERIGTGLRRAGPVDALVAHLHGACSAEGVDDVEGAQLGIARAVLGPDVPILVTLDHHANVTRQIVAHSTAIVGHRTQPHDTYDTGRVSGALLVRMLRGEVKPVIAWRKLRIITHQEQYLTAAGPMKAWFDQARAMEADPRVLHVAPCPMQPWLDVAEGGWATVVTVDGDRQLAERLAEESAAFAWERREAFMAKEAVAIDAAVRQADAEPRGVVVLSDTGDTVFGGAAGDSNLILEAVLRLGIRNRALIPLISPATARRLAEAGEGAEVTLPVGGDSCPHFFTPLTVTGRVRKVAPGKVNVAVFQQPDFDQGTTVIFEVGPVTLFVTERSGAAGNVPDVYRAFGIEPADYQMAVLKTASNFQFFRPITSRVIRVDTSGPGQSDVRGLPWRRVPRPIFPLDPIGSWEG
jgi:microcystin degradation protein MlrC